MPPHPNLLPRGGEGMRCVVAFFPNAFASGPSRFVTKRIRHHQIVCSLIGAGHHLQWCYSIGCLRQRDYSDAVETLRMYPGRVESRQFTAGAGNWRSEIFPLRLVQRRRPLGLVKMIYF